MIRISSELRGQLLALAAASPDVEVCGLLFGDDEAITAIAPAANVSLAPHDSFEIDPATLIAAHRAMRSGGPRMVGWYHSHPNGVRTPSERDNAAMAEVGGLWLIIGKQQIGLWHVEGGQCSEISLLL